MFSESEIERYSRHIALEGVGPRGQKRLKEGSVLVVGAGGLASPAVLYLAAAGVGRIGIADGDKVELSNLQRQVAHTTANIGRSKAASAAEAARAINPHVCVEPHEEFFTAANAMSLVGQYDFVLEATDNFTAKYLVNDTCVAAAKPCSIAGITGFGGQTLTHLPGTACYRCLFPEEPGKGECSTCREAGVLGVVPGIVGTIQAAEALKYLLGVGSLLTDTLLTFDALTMSFARLAVEPCAQCPTCGKWGAGQ